MGRLNSFIKFVVLNANALLFLGGIGTIIVASIILSADFITLAKSYIQARGIFVVASGILIIAMTIIGCVGTHRQVQRDRAWSGRRLLSVYQVLLITVIVGQGLVRIVLYRIEVNLEEAREGLPEEHGEFESRVRSGFNAAFFDQQCPNRGGDSWIWSIVEDNCPETLSENACQCLEEEEPEFIPITTPATCAEESTYSYLECCPDLAMCESGMDAACPYFVCRSGVLGLLLNYITPARKYSSFVVTLEGVALVLTCLLICYNPRDSTEDILIKTGALVRGAQGFSAAGGAGDKSGGATIDSNFAVHLVQPTDGLMSVARKNPSRSTPAMSPVAASSDAPSVPFLQFMSPRHAHDDGMMGAPDSPVFEFHNTALTSKAFLVGAAAGKSTAAAVGPRPNKSFGETAQLSGGATGTTERSVGGETKRRTHSSSSRGGSDVAGPHGGEEKVAETSREEQVSEVPGRTAAPVVRRPQRVAMEEELVWRLDVSLNSVGLNEGPLGATTAIATRLYVGGGGTREPDSLSSNTVTPTSHAATPSHTNTGDDDDIFGNATVTAGDDGNHSDVLGVTTLSTPISASPSQPMALAVQTNSTYTGSPPTPTPTAGTTPSLSTSASPLVSTVVGTEPHMQLQIEVPPANGALSKPAGGRSRFSSQTPISSSLANETPSLPLTVASAAAAAAAAAAAMPPGYTAWQSQHAEEAAPPSSEQSGGPSRPAGRPPSLFGASLQSLSPLPEASASASTKQAQNAVETGNKQLHVEVPAINGASSNPSGGCSRFAAQTPILPLPAIGASPAVATVGVAAAASPPGNTEGDSYHVEETVPSFTEHVNLQLQDPSVDSPLPQMSPPRISPLSVHPPLPSAISAGGQGGAEHSPSQEALQDARKEIADGSKANSTISTISSSSSTSSSTSVTEKKNWFKRVVQLSQQSMSPPQISPLVPSTVATGSGQGRDWGSEQKGVPVSAADGTTTASTCSLAQQLLSSPPSPPVASTPYALPTTSEGPGAAGVASPPTAVDGATTSLRISVPPFYPTTASGTAGYSTGSEVLQAGVPNDNADGARSRAGMLEQTPPVSPPIPRQGSSRRFSTEPGSGDE